MIKLIAIAGFALAFATSAEAMTPAPIPQPDSVRITSCVVKNLATARYSRRSGAPLAWLAQQIWHPGDIAGNPSRLVFAE